MLIHEGESGSEIIQMNWIQITRYYAAYLTGRDTIR